MASDSGFLAQSIRRLYEILVEHGIEPETARRAVTRAEQGIRKEYGGRRVYIPALEKRERDARIVEEHGRRKGEPGLQTALAKEFGLDRSMISRIVARSR